MTVVSETRMPAATAPSAAGVRSRVIVPLRFPDGYTATAEVLTFHGLADPQNTYDGHVPGRNGEWVESVPDALAGWAKHDGCDANVVQEDPPGPLSVLRYEGCKGGAEVRLIRVDGLVHRWARDEVDATAVAWEFFKKHAL
jgi:polyhydroxybutyrate depolymerase